MAFESWAATGGSNEAKAGSGQPQGVMTLLFLNVPGTSLALSGQTPVQPVEVFGSDGWRPFSGLMVAVLVRAIGTSHMDFG